MELDFAYESRRLAIEALGAEYHLPAFNQDSERTQRLAALGWSVVTVTSRQLDRDPEGVLRRLDGALGRRGRQRAA